MKMFHRLLFFGGGAGLVASLVFLGVTDDLQEHIPLFLGVYAVAFGFYVAGAYAVSRHIPTKTRLPFIIVVAVLARLVLIGADPSLSTDAYRYLWEGRVVVNGGNPFELAPDAPALESLRDDNFEPINHKHLATIYPPFAQSVFALAAWIHPSILTLKLFFMFFDLAAIFILAGLLRAFGRPVAQVTLYAWNPLVIFETAHSGHVDVVGLMFLLLGLYFLVRGRSRWSAVALAVSFLTKFSSVILAPFFAFNRQLAPLLVLGAVIVAVGYVPYLGAGTKLFSSLVVYGSEWHFNGPAYFALAAITGEAAARIVLAGAAIGAIFFYAKRETDPVHYAFLSLGTILLLSPTFYPWYVIWIVPFACLEQSRAWILLTATIFLSYWVWIVLAETGKWELPVGVYAIEFLPFFLLLVRDRMRP